MKNMIAGLLLAVGASSANAALTITAVAPTTDGGDQASLAGAGNFGRSFNGNDSDVGQTITTGSNVGGYNLNAVAFQVKTTRTEVANATFAIRIVTVDALGNGVELTDITSGFTFTGDATALDYFIFHFADVLVAANQVYSVEARITDVGDGVKTANYTMAANSNAYTPGGLQNNVHTLPTSGYALAGSDAQFHVNLVAIPEPSSTALLGLGGLALILRRRK